MAATRSSIAARTAATSSMLTAFFSRLCASDASTIRLGISQNDRAQPIGRIQDEHNRIAWKATAAIGERVQCHGFQLISPQVTYLSIVLEGGYARTQRRRRHRGREQAGAT